LVLAPLAWPWDMQSGMSASAKSMMMSSKLLTTTEQDALASRTGPRRTVYYTKQLSNEAGGQYARTHQYLGEWKSNKWEGKGTLEKADGERYVGEWLNGQRHGTGTLWKREKDGSLRKVYSGQWSHGQMAGKGHFIDEKTGDMYVGEFQNGLRSGMGICTYTSGDVYEGEWLNGNRHGFGVFDYKNGDHFEGLWVEDKKEGKGVHFYYHVEKKAHTKRYDGEWVDDVPKCGAYTEMPPDQLAPLTSIPDPIPSVELVDAEGVLSQRLAEIRAERTAVRTKRVKLEEMFTPEELEALRLAFDRIDTAQSGMLAYDKLLPAMQQVGMSPEDMQLVSVVAQLGKSVEHSFSFPDFAQMCDMLSPVEQ